MSFHGFCWLLTVGRLLFVTTYEVDQKEQLQRDTIADHRTTDDGETEDRSTSQLDLGSGTQKEEQYTLADVSLTY